MLTEFFIFINGSIKSREIRDIKLIFLNYIHIKLDKKKKKNINFIFNKGG